MTKINLMRYNLLSIIFPKKLLRILKSTLKTLLRLKFSPKYTAVEMLRNSLLF